MWEEQLVDPPIDYITGRNIQHIISSPGQKYVHTGASNSSIMSPFYSSKMRMGDVRDG